MRSLAHSMSDALAIRRPTVYTKLYGIQPHVPEERADLLSMSRIRVLWHREAIELGV
jgi:hypothetical protein